MKCQCGREILKQMVTPDIYYKDYNNLPIISYTYKCMCGRTTIISKKQFAELEK